MGIPFFSALIYDYLISSIDGLQQVNLAGRDVIIDGNSFIHFIYNEIMQEDRNKGKSQRLTGTPFGYDGCWKMFRDKLALFKEKCSNVVVVFDGILKSTSRRRPDPRSENPDDVDTEDQQYSPRLLRHELYSILRELDIETVVAPGEADPVIVKMARQKRAYIVSGDSDYHLYQLPHGFVPLRYLDFKRLTGPSFQLADVFDHLDAAGVALWATFIHNTFVEDLKTLQEFCSRTAVKDEKRLRQWLDTVGADKRQWITTQVFLLRFIQKVGTNDAYKQLITFVPQTERAQFDQIINSYIIIPEETSLSTQNDNDLPRDIEERLISGQLDRKWVEILINAKLPASWQDLSSLNFRLLLPVCHILLRWNSQTREGTIPNSIVTHKEQQFNLFEIIQVEVMPLLQNILTLSKNDQKYYVLYCINFALDAPMDRRWNQVNKDFILWLSLLKLWFHEYKNRTSLAEWVLRALVISFLKHVLLDTFDEEERDVQTTQLPSPLLQHSIKELKNQFSLEACASLREKVNRYAETILSDESITLALHEFEQFYESLTMINQFFAYPLDTHLPHLCINSLTYKLAIVFSKSNNILKDISILFKDQDFLIDLMNEILQFIFNN